MADVDVPELITTVGNVVLVRWRIITVEGVQRATGAAKAAAAKAGEPVIYIAMVGNGVSTPDEAARQALVDGIQPTLKVCSSMNLVLDGSGMKFVTLRSAAATMFLLKGDRRMKMYNSLHETLQERAPAKLEILLTHARVEGLIAA